MYILPTEFVQSAVWQRWDSDGHGHRLLAIGVWTEKRAGAGEDAEPLVLHHRPDNRGLTAVFDGAGGAGAGRAGRTAQGIERSGAWAGSRAARATTEEWFLPAIESWPADVDGLRRRLVERLSQLRAPGRRKIGGTMRRELPTTLAALDYLINPHDVHWQALWAGDSRCYLLGPGDGLQQLTRDDTEAVDTLVQLREDPPMTNLVSADRGFRINAAPGSAPLPAVLLCATDGFFGDVRTPADFEHVLLANLRAANDAAEWAARLAADVSGYSGDDASLSLVAIGFDDFSVLRGQFEYRASLVADQHWSPVLHAAKAGHDELLAARTDSWQRYRAGYLQRMPEPAPAGRHRKGAE